MSVKRFFNERKVGCKMKKLLFIGLLSFLNLSASGIEHINSQIQRQQTAQVRSVFSLDTYTDFQKNVAAGSVGMLVGAGVLGYQAYDLVQQGIAHESFGQCVAGSVLGVTTIVIAVSAANRMKDAYLYKNAHDAINAWYAKE